MTINFELSHVIAGMVGAFMFWIILRYGEYDEKETSDTSLLTNRQNTDVREDPYEPSLDIEDLLEDDGPLQEDTHAEGYYLWWGEPYIADDQKVLGVLFEAVKLIQAQGLLIEVLRAKADTAVAPKQAEPLSFPEIPKVEESLPILTEVAEPIHTPELSLVDDRSEAEIKLAPKDTGRPLSSPYDAWMFPRKN